MTEPDGATTMHEALAELRRRRDEATDHGEPDRAALLHLLIVIEELSETVGELHERVTRLERRAAVRQEPGAAR
jgi:hypothetical protein